MLLSTALPVLALVAIFYMAVDSWVYRRPWVLLVAGLIVASLSILIKSGPLLMKSVVKDSWSAAELDLAAAVVDPTLVGLAGGLIASAFILKLQILHARDLARARDNLARALARAERAERADEDLKLVASSLSNDEFWSRLRQIKNRQLDALDHQYEAEERLRALTVPGLSEPPTSSAARNDV